MARNGRLAVDRGIVSLMAAEEAVLLHLSDLHFGADETAHEFNERDLCLAKLLETIQSLPPDWRPNAVVITGDLGWKGHADDYKDATLWLSSLSTVLKIEPAAFLLCPGNHDIDRAMAKKISRPAANGDIPNKPVRNCGMVNITEDFGGRSFVLGTRSAILQR
jgi:predicted MPP superfamily phosphohydrolase